MGGSLGSLIQQQIADELDLPQRTISDWLSENTQLPEFANDHETPPGATEDRPWGVIREFDLWMFHQPDDDNSYYGRMAPQVMQNLLWLFTGSNASGAVAFRAVHSATVEGERPVRVSNRGSNAQCHCAFRHLVI